jgi:hypothetical protein
MTLNVPLLRFCCCLPQLLSRLLCDAVKPAAILTTQVDEETKKQTEKLERDMAKGAAEAATKPVVFGGKVYNIPIHQTAQEAFQNATHAQNARRQMKLKFDKSAVVVKPRTMALVKATGREWLPSMNVSFKSNQALKL